MLAVPTNHNPSSELPSSPPKPFIIKSNNVLLDSHEEPVPAFILIQNGKILDILIPSEIPPESLSQQIQGYDIKDYGDLFIFPGLVDSNVHLHADYDDHWENIEYSTKLAAAGGVTTIIDNPVMCAPFDSGDEYVESLSLRIQKIQEKSKVDFGVLGILEPKTKTHIQEMKKAGVLGLKCYLMSCFQNTIGNFEREQFEELLENLEEDAKNSDLLLMIHPEMATDRELYLTSPCRTLPLRRRVDMLHSFKSIELGGAANKGSYIDDFDKKKRQRTVEAELGIEDNEEEEQEKEITCSIGEIQSATKLENRVWEAKEKTDLHDLVKYELSSYNFEGGSQNEEDRKDGESTPDSDNEFLEQLSKHSSQAFFNFMEGDNEKKSMNSMASEEEKTPAEALDLARSNSCGGRLNISPVRKSLFANLRNEEQAQQPNPSSGRRNFEASLAHIEETVEEAKKTTQDLIPCSKEEEEDEEEDSQADENEDFDDIFKDRKLAKESKAQAEKELESFDGPQPKQQEESPENGPESPNLLISLAKKLSETQQQQSPEETEYNKDTLTTTAESPLILNEESKAHDAQPENEGQASPGLAARRRNSPVKKYGLLVTSWMDKEDTESLENNENVRKISFSYQNISSGNDSSPIQQQENKPTEESPEPSQERWTGGAFRARATTPSNSSLLARRITFKANTLPGKQYPESAESTPLRKFGKFDSLSISKNSEDSGQKEIQMNQSYRVFLANRHQGWEENAVSVVLGALRPETKLKVMFQNLSLASSFLKIRQRKKGNEAWAERIFADTSPIYLYFSEKMVKKGETKYKLSPPFRNKDNKKLLLEDLRLNAIDTVSSYHFYVPQEYKLVKHGNFRRAFSGMEVIGCSIQAAWTSLYGHQKKNNSKISDQSEHKKMVGKIMKQICKTMCENPARILKIGDRKGRIAKGLDADLVIWDPFKLDKNEHLDSEHGFSGKALIGSVCKTYLRGQLIYDGEGVEVKEEIKGEFIRL